MKNFLWKCISLEILMLFTNIVIAQDAYVIPFASKDNTIELAVANTSRIMVQEATVTVQDAPSWVKFTAKNQTISNLRGNTDKPALFAFSIDKTAPVGKEEKVVFQITTENNQHWNKEIKIKAGAPDKFELYRNFPNPFNPTTTIAYQLPIDSKVNLKVYDILGREVSTLINNEIKHAGYYEQRFSASHLASGMYIYQLVWIDAQGKTQRSNKSMLLIK